MPITPPRVSAAPTPTVPTIVASETCVNCGSVLHGPYCARCGERRATARDYSFWAFLQEGFQTFTNADGSFLTSLKLLVTKPGALTAAYMRGRRVGLMRPLQLFLLVNVVYFLFASTTRLQVLSTSLNNHMNNTWHSGLATRMVNRRLGDGTVSAAEYDRRLRDYRKRFDETVDVQAKTLIFAMVPVFALFTWLLQLRKRRYLVEHIVFSLHIYSAFLIFGVGTLVLLGVPIALTDALFHTRLADSPTVDTTIGLCLSGLLVWYLARALTRTYGDRPLSSIFGALYLTVALVITLFAYRTLLFLTAFWATPA